MSFHPELFQRAHEHVRFGTSLPSPALLGNHPQLAAYRRRVADYYLASTMVRGCGAYLVSALARIEDVLPAALQELVARPLGEVLNESAEPPTSLNLREEELLVEAMTGDLYATGDEYSALFDAVLGFASAKRLPATSPELAGFARSFHELLHVRVRVGDREREGTVLKVIAEQFGAAAIAMQHIAQDTPPPQAIEVLGDAGRLHWSQWLPDAWKYSAEQRTSTTATSSISQSADGRPGSPDDRQTTSAPAIPQSDDVAFGLAAPMPTDEPSDFAFEHLAEGAVYMVPVGALRAHPKNDALFAPVDADAQRALEDDLKAHGAEHPLLVCGVGCASPAGTILRGHRRHAGLIRAGATTAPVLTAAGLSAEAELFAMIRGNLADAHARKLTEEAKYLLEEELRRTTGERRGRPRPRDNSVETNGISGQETADAIARKLNETSNAVRDRQKVFGSPCTTPKLKTATNKGALKTSPAAALVREVEREFGLGRGHTARDEKKTLDAARSAIDARLAEMLTRRPRSRASKPKPRDPVNHPRPETAQTEKVEARAQPTRDVELFPELGTISELASRLQDRVKRVVEQEDVRYTQASLPRKRQRNRRKSPPTKSRLLRFLDPALEILRPIVKGELRAHLLTVASTISLKNEEEARDQRRRAQRRAKASG